MTLLRERVADINRRLTEHGRSAFNLLSADELSAIGGYATKKIGIDPIGGLLDVDELMVRLSQPRMDGELLLPSSERNLVHALLKHFWSPLSAVATLFFGADEGRYYLSFKQLMKDNPDAHRGTKVFDLVRVVKARSALYDHLMKIIRSATCTTNSAVLVVSVLHWLLNESDGLAYGVYRHHNREFGLDITCLGLALHLPYGVDTLVMGDNGFAVKPGRDTWLFVPLHLPYSGIPALRTSTFATVYGLTDYELENKFAHKYRVAPLTPGDMPGSPGSSAAEGLPAIPQSPVEPVLPADTAQRLERKAVLAKRVARVDRLRLELAEMGGRQPVGSYGDRLNVSDLTDTGLEDAIAKACRTTDKLERDLAKLERDLARKKAKAKQAVTPPPKAPPQSPQAGPADSEKTKSAKAAPGPAPKRKSKSKTKPEAEDDEAAYESFRSLVAEKSEKIAVAEAAMTEFCREQGDSFIQLYAFLRGFYSHIEPSKHSLIQDLFDCFNFDCFNPDMKKFDLHRTVSRIFCASHMVHAVKDDMAVRIFRETAEAYHTRINPDNYVMIFQNLYRDIVAWGEDTKTLVHIVDTFEKLGDRLGDPAFRLIEKLTQLDFFPIFNLEDRYLSFDTLRISVDNVIAQLRAYLVPCYVFRRLESPFARFLQILLTMRRLLDDSFCPGTTSTYPRAVAAAGALNELGEQLHTSVAMFSGLFSAAGAVGADNIEHQAAAFVYAVSSGFYNPNMNFSIDWLNNPFCFVTFLDDNRTFTLADLLFSCEAAKQNRSGQQLPTVILFSEEQPLRQGVLPALAEPQIQHHAPAEAFATLNEFLTWVDEGRDNLLTRVKNAATLCKQKGKAG
jgi:hypothetical protein